MFKNTKSGLQITGCRGTIVSILHPQRIMSPVIMSKGQVYVEGLLCAKLYGKSLTCITLLYFQIIPRW